MANSHFDAKSENQRQQASNKYVLTFGAPLTVPTGNAARRASQQVRSSRNSPVA